MNPNPQTPDELAKVVRDALLALKQRRRVFHSEADFQLELFRTMTHGGIFSRVMMEKKFPTMPRKRVDIYANGVALELKEKAGECLIEEKGELFNLRGDAQFTLSNLKSSHEDIQRITHLVGGESEVKIGFVVILTSRNFPDAKDKLLGIDLPDNCKFQFEEGVWSEISKKDGCKFVTRYFLVEVRKKP